MENTTLRADKRGRVTRSLEERQRFIEEFRSSGLIKRVFARERGIAYNTLCTWLKASKPFTKGGRSSSAGGSPKSSGVRLKEVETVGMLMGGPVVEVIYPGGTVVRVYRG